MKTSKLINIKELSIYLDIPVSTLYQHCSKELIPFYKIGGSLRFNLTEVLESFSGPSEETTSTLDVSLDGKPSLKTEYKSKKDHLDDPFKKEKIK